MKYKLKHAIAVMLMSASASTTIAQKERSDIEDKFKCNLNDLYASDEF